MHGSFFDECIGLMATLTPRKHMSMANWTILAAVICVAYSHLAHAPLSPRLPLPPTPSPLIDPLSSDITFPSTPDTP